MQQATTEQKLRALLIIHGALLAGVLIFAGIVLVLNRPAAGMAPNALLAMRVACVSIFAGAVILATVLRRAAIGKLAARTGEPSESECMMAFAGVSIARAAIAEGGSLLAVILYMMSADVTDLVLVAGGAVILAAMIPLPSKWRSFVEAIQDVREQRERSRA